MLGDPKDPLSPSVFHQLSLVAFLAWVGLGADGLSSSCYGPEEAFLHLGSERFLALFLVIATALMLSHGVEKTMGRSGQADTVVVLRKSSEAELNSGIDSPQVSWR